MTSPMSILGAPSVSLLVWDFRPSNTATTYLDRLLEFLSDHNCDLPFCVEVGRETLTERLCCVSTQSRC